MFVVYDLSNAFSSSGPICRARSKNGEAIRFDRQDGSFPNVDDLYDSDPVTPGESAVPLFFADRKSAELFAAVLGSSLDMTLQEARDEHAALFMSVALTMIEDIKSYALEEFQDDPGAFVFDVLYPGVTGFCNTVVVQVVVPSERRVHDVHFAIENDSDWYEAPEYFYELVGSFVNDELTESSFPAVDASGGDDDEVFYDDGDDYEEEDFSDDEEDEEYFSDDDGNDDDEDNVESVVHEEIAGTAPALNMTDEQKQALERVIDALKEQVASAVAEILRRAGR